MSAPDVLRGSGSAAPGVVVDSFIDKAMRQNRAVLLSLLALLVAGVAVYLRMPKEFYPDVEVPLVNVRLVHFGISPEDSERLLVRPVEQELRTLEGVKSLNSLAYQDGANLVVEFDAGRDTDASLAEVRARVDMAKSKLPADSEEPVVVASTMAEQQPILVLNVKGTAPERTLTQLARRLRDRIEAVPGVLRVNLTGAREELLEITIDPRSIESYGLSQAEVLQLVQRNNRIVAAGSLQAAQGSFPVKIPGVIEDATDLLNLPVKAIGDRLVRLSDVATVRRTFKDAETFSRINGEQAIALEVVQRGNSNVLQTALTVKDVIAEAQRDFPAGAGVVISTDRSNEILDQSNELQSHILSAVLLVVILIVATLGVRNAALVAVSIPGSFLAGILVLAMLGMTMNMVTMFALIISVGIVVDGAIIVVEFADRKMAEGLAPRAAYAIAARRMFWPVVCSIGATLVAFVPLAFWPGSIGKMMMYMPVTLVAVLAASIVMALLYVPVMGAAFGGSGGGTHDAGERHNLAIAETGDLEQLTGLTGRYYRFLKWALRHPGRVAASVCGLLLGIFVLFGLFNPGVDMMPRTDPTYISVDVRARGDLSSLEKDALVRAAEARLAGMADVKYHYAKTGAGGGGTAMGQTDQVGTIQLILVNWRDRRSSVDALMEEARRRLVGLPGAIADVRRSEGMSGGGKRPIDILVAAQSVDQLLPAVERLRAALDAVPGVINARDNRSLPGIEWRLEVNRALAARFGADVTTIGSAVQLVTNGVKVGEFRPDDADDEIDIRVRLPYGQRTLEQLDAMRVMTNQGMVPISTFVTRSAHQKISTISKTDTRPTMRIEADLAPGALADQVTREVRTRLPALGLDPGVSVAFEGTAKDQSESSVFLSIALLVAMAMIAIILVLEFNSISQTFLILTAIVFAAGGVLLGYLVTRNPFGLVMGGLGIITLTGIVVNNNIVLIDTYNALRAAGVAPYEAVIRTCIQRARPVLLTKVTIILALLPMVFEVNVDLVHRDITVGGNSGAFWSQLATAVVAGAAFATLLTLLFTPALLLLQAGAGERWRRWRGARAGAPAGTAAAPG
ncbi:MAG: efflux RND transporter permease subunit [Steroidobacteraceae bacterium]|nr:efflux RND transporter permease subunit [Steroidobacteraceae bacterium]